MSNVIILFTLMSKYRYTGNTKMKAYTECLLNSLQFTECIIVVWLHCLVSHDTVRWPPAEMSHGITPYLNPVGV